METENHSSDELHPDEQWAKSLLENRSKGKKLPEITSQNENKDVQAALAEVKQTAEESGWDKKADETKKGLDAIQNLSDEEIDKALSPLEDRTEKIPDLTDELEEEKDGSVEIDVTDLTQRRPEFATGTQDLRPRTPKPKSEDRTN